MKIWRSEICGGAAKSAYIFLEQLVVFGFDLVKHLLDRCYMDSRVGKVNNQMLKAGQVCELEV